jgi:hypothetical protein
MAMKVIIYGKDTVVRASDLNGRIYNTPSIIFQVLINFQSLVPMFDAVLTKIGAFDMDK